MTGIAVINFNQDLIFRSQDLNGSEHFRLNPFLANDPIFYPLKTTENQGYNQGVQKRYEKQKILQPRKSIEKYHSKTGQSLLLENVDSMTQNYIEGMTNWGAVITWSKANAAAKALIRKYPGIIGEINVDYSYRVQGLFRRIRFSRCRETFTKVDIPEAAQKEVEYFFLHEITLKVEKNAIPDYLVINFDQTPDTGPMWNSTLAKKNRKPVTIVGAGDKRSITDTFYLLCQGISPRCN